MEIRGSANIEWMYPNVYNDASLAQKRDTLTITLMHVRAADSIQIEFDADRNGWVIRMDKTKDMDGYSDVVEEKQEVAFVPAWNEDGAAQE